MFYVYELIDPRDGSVFYVGKGTGSRLSAHRREAIKGVASSKCDRIRAILSAGLNLESRVVREFEQEQHAYDFERARIARYGRHRLTNIMPGGGSAKVIEAPKPLSRRAAALLLIRIAQAARPPTGIWAAALYRSLQRKLPQLLGFTNA